MGGASAQAHLSPVLVSKSASCRPADQSCAQSACNRSWLVGGVCDWLGYWYAVRSGRLFFEARVGGS